MPHVVVVVGGGVKGKFFTAKLAMVVHFGTFILLFVVAMVIVVSLG